MFGCGEYDYNSWENQTDVDEVVANNLPWLM